MSTPAIVIENLGKRYKIGRAPTGKGGWAGLLNGLRGHLDRLRILSEHGSDDEFVWALRDLHLEVQPGEVVGFIGRNGAGKSTLLKILSRVVTPTTGRAEIRGRVGSLLEVGTGFHPELTGRENIFLNGAILGMRRAEIRDVFDEIVAFADVGRFLDTPVKRYSSGMFVRLAFAVAAHLEPEVLIIDEVLAVGDTEFQRKCMGKVGEVARGGRTVLFVSHNMGVIRSMCDRAVLLEGGQAVADGTPEEVVARYLSAANAAAEVGGCVTWPDVQTAPGGEFVRLAAVRLLGPDGEPHAMFDYADPIVVEVDYRVLQQTQGMRVVVGLLTPDGAVAFFSTDHQLQPARREPGVYRSRCTIPGKLLNATRYTLRVLVGAPGHGRQLVAPVHPLKLDVAAGMGQGSRRDETWAGAVAPSLPWCVEALAAGPVLAEVAG